MEYCRVTIPLVQVLPRRKAEPGIELAHPVYDQDGRIIAEPGLTVTEDHLKQFENFDVRKLVIQNEQTRWLPIEMLDDLPPSAECLECKEFGSVAETIIEDLYNDESLRKFRETAEFLTKQAEQQKNTRRAEELRQLVDETRDLQQQLSDLYGELDRIDDETTREKIIKTIEGTVSELGSSFLNLSAPQSLLKEALNFYNDRESVRTSLTNIISAEPELVPDQEALDRDFRDEAMEVLETPEVEDSIKEQMKQNLRSWEEKVSELRPEHQEFDPTREQQSLIHRALYESDTPSKDRLVEAGFPEYYAKRLWEASEERSTFRDLLESLEADGEVNPDRVQKLDTESTKESKTGARETNGSATDDIPFEPSDFVEQDIEELIRDGDTVGLQSQTDLDEAQVKIGLEGLQEPIEPNPHARSMVDWTKAISHSIFWKRTISESAIKKAHQSAKKLRREASFLDLIVQPPRGEQYFLSHINNVWVIMESLQPRLDLTDQEMVELIAGGFLMDMGMTEIPMGLWAKNSPLSPRAENEIHQHPFHSDSIGKQVLGESGSRDLAREHHERLDGSGYPEGLEAEEQHPQSRILAVVDTFAALIEKRPYREPIHPDEAFGILLKNVSQYDQELVHSLARGIGFYPETSVVALESGELARVIDHNENHPSKPRVLVLTDEQQNRLDSPRELDLENRDSSVQRIVRT